MPIKPDAVLVIDLFLLSANTYTDVHLVIYDNLNVYLIHAPPLNVVNPTKLLQIVLVITLQKRLFDIFVKIYLLHMLKTKNSKLHNIDSHKALY